MFGLSIIVKNSDLIRQNQSVWQAIKRDRKMVAKFTKSCETEFLKAVKNTFRTTRRPNRKKCVEKEESISYYNSFILIV